MDNRPSPLRPHLKKVLRQWSSTIILQGLAITASTGVVLIGVSMLLDSFFGLDMLMRTGLLVLCLAGVAIAVIQSLIRPLRHVPTDMQVARYIEEQHPELNDGFVSAVEFEGQKMDGTAKTFLDRLMSQIQAQSTEINFSKVIHRRRLYRAEGMALVAIVLLALFAVQDVELFRRSTTRIAAPWTRPGPLLSTELEVNPGDVRIPRGGDQVVNVKLRGKLVPSVKMFSRPEGQDEWYPVEMFETEENGAFTYEVVGIFKHTEYYIDARPATSSTYTITVYDPPRIEQINVAYRYPQYTGRARRTEEDKGDITAPVGTTVTLTITANKSIESGKLAFSNDTKSNLKVDDVTLAGSFEITEDLSYTVNIIDTDDQRNENPVEYYIRALPDNAPRVTINNPGRDTKLSPIDEMAVRVEAEDDFGLSSLNLVYSVNGGKDQTIDMATEENQKSRTLWDGEHYLYLEEMSVEPGDFIAYYAEASDHRGENGTTRTDMFFTTVRPFEEIYRQGQGGGGGGAGVAGLRPGKLSQEQKEIIAATWRVDSDRKHVPEQQTKDDLNAVADAQDALRVRVEESVSVLLFQGAMDLELQEMSDLLQQAQAPMVSASEELRSERSAEALGPEREALHYLLKVDALIREYMVSQQRNNQGRSSAPLDMSDTSELELKRDDNKYETLDQANQAQQQQETVDGSLQRVKDLARRQQQLNEQMRQQANQAQRSEAEKKRELDRLTREQRQLRQQAEEMSRQLSQMSRQQEQQSSTSQQSPRQAQQSMQQASGSLRESSDEMGQSAQELQRNNPQAAAEQGSRALQRLQDSTQQLVRAQGRSLERMMRDTIQRADQLATQQEQLARAVGELKKEEDRGFQGIKARVEALNNGRGSLTQADKERQAGQFVRRRLQDIAEAKGQVGDQLERLKDDLEFLSLRATADQPQSAKVLRQAREEINDKGLKQKIERSKLFLRPNSLERSLTAENDLAKALEQLAERVRSAQDKFPLPDRAQLARNQDRTRETMSEFLDLQRRLNRMQRRPPLPGQEEALSRQYRDQLQNLQDLADQLPQNAQQTQNLQNQLRRAVSLGNEPWKFDRDDWDELRQDVGKALIDVHRVLGNRIEGVEKREKLFMARDEEVPPQYRDLVNKYYESLSKESNKKD